MALPAHVQEKRNDLAKKVIQDIETGKPFFWDAGHSGGLPHNGVTGSRYRGGNAVALLITAKERGYTDNRWLTYSQANKKGWKIKKGEHGIRVEFWTDKKVVEEINQETGKKEKKLEELEHPVVRNYIVFNAEQIDGITLESAKPLNDADKNKYMENMLKNSEAMIFEDQMVSNFYNIKEDEVHVMPRKYFKTLDQFYAVCAHEIAHSTGNEKRLNRSMNGSFGTPEYAKEELRAEMASMFLHQEYGIQFDDKHYENHAAYLQSWAKAIKDDPNELYKAAADAQKIADYVETRMILKDLIQDKEDSKEEVKTYFSPSKTVDIGNTRILPLAPETVAYMNQVAQDDKNYKISSDSPFVKISQRAQKEMQAENFVSGDENTLETKKPTKRALRVTPEKNNRGCEMELSR